MKLNALKSFRPGFFLALLLPAAATIALDASAADNPPAKAESFELPSKDSPDVAWWRDSMTTRDQRLQWFRDARFGMFMHWGVYSGLGNEFHGKKGGGYAEHIQRILDRKSVV